MHWQIKKEEKYTLYTPMLSDDQDLINAFSQLDVSENKIIDCSSISFDEALKSEVSRVYEKHFEEQLSFIVVVDNKLLMEELEELFVVVPTISEAIDYLYMEELERNI